MSYNMNQQEGEITIPEELTERQARIVKFQLRGMTQRAIAKVLQVSQPMVAKEIRKIRKVFKEYGKHFDSEIVVGETHTLFQEVEYKAWELYYKAKENNKIGEANKALNTIMTARERNLKLMMELGVIKRAATEHKHTLDLPPFMKKWEESNIPKEEAAGHIIEAELSELEEPVPPQLPKESSVEEITYETSEEEKEEQKAEPAATRNKES